MHDVKVRAFARHMQTQLDANTNRGGWRDARGEQAREHAMALLGEAFSKLREVAPTTRELQNTAEHQAAIREACADLANCALIVADVCNVIQYLPTDNG